MLQILAFPLVFINPKQLSQAIITVILLTLYLIHCQKCPEAQYIGETGGSFRYRFNNHTHSIRQKKLLPLPLHFNADDHNINDLIVCILRGNFKDTKHGKLTELLFIINFGFNKDISFLSKYDTFKH